MKKLHILAPVAALLLASCTLEPYELGNEELMMRSYIRKYGLFDQQHTWNLAQDVSVTVNPGDNTEIVVYAVFNNHNYKVAHLHYAKGETKIPVDVPQGTKELIVRVGAHNYRTVPGGYVDVDNPSSRSVGRGNGVVSVRVNPDEDKYFYFTAGAMLPILSGDQGNPNVEWSYTDHSGLAHYGYGSILPEEVDNKNLSNIITDFSFVSEGDPVIIYPMYWNTRDRHILGVYFYNEAGTAIEGHVPIYIDKDYGESYDYIPTDITVTGESGKRERTINADVVSSINAPTGLTQIHRPGHGPATMP